MANFLILAVTAGVAAAALGAAPSTQAPGDVARGQAFFNDHCSFCHAFEGMGAAPSLAGVVGRKAGAVADFSYTPAMKASGLTWTAPQLDKFLVAPQAVVPGTAMTVAVPNAGDRADVIAYLSSLS
ncbi:MAG TPA: c-type cytochrome [Caulobacteraceae bacterium]|nr:c-type cytochrome [Caulobacteraceae bacterium]